MNSLILTVATPLIISLAPNKIENTVQYDPIRQANKVQQDIDTAKRLEQERLAKIETERVAAQKALELAQAQKQAQVPVAIQRPSVAVVSGCGDNQYAHFIYSHESGCDSNKWNSSGCYGIGQSCPASKIAHCGSDYSCQNAFFTNYANKAYGGWAGAYAFWIRNHWW